MIDEIAKRIEQLGNLLDKLGGLKDLPMPDLSSSFSLPSSPSQMSEKYCCACLQRHIASAIHFINEAKRFGKKEKLKEAFVEIAGAESELERTQFKDAEVRRRMEEIMKELRNVRLKLARGEAVDLNPLLDKAMGACDLYIRREQREQVVAALSRAGVEGDKIEEASKIVLAAAAGDIEMEEASERLQKLLGWKKLKLEWDEKKGLVLRGEKE